MSETELREAARMLAYLWEAETLNGTRVCDLFYDDDPLTQDVPRILASTPAEPEQDFTGHQRAYPGTVGPLGWQAQAIPAEPEQADEVAGLDAAATQRLVMAERGRIQAGWDHWRDLLTADQNAAVAFVLYAAGEQPEMTPERAAHYADLIARLAPARDDTSGGAS